MPNWSSPGFYETVTRLEAAVSVKKEAGETPDPQYADIAEQYTRLPELSRQVTQYAFQLTLEQDTPYKKAYAIMERLRRDYTYNLDVPYVPRYAELVEWFMETREGYCTYFATAMTVLARTAGIPARYVEGFSLYNLSPDKNGVYTVTGAQAHAWCEVYLEGIGWIPFDATAPVSSARLPEASPENDPNNPDSEENTPEDIQPEAEDTSSPSSAPTEQEDTHDTGGKKPFPWTFIILAVIAVAAALKAVPAALTVRFRSSRLLRKYPPGKCLLVCWRDILNMLKYWGLSPKPGETCMKLSERAGERLSFTPYPFSQIAQMTELYIYGGIEPELYALSAAIAFRSEIDRKSVV